MNNESDATMTEKAGCDQWPCESAKLYCLAPLKNKTKLRHNYLYIEKLDVHNRKNDTASLYRKFIWGDWHKKTKNSGYTPVTGLSWSIAISTVCILRLMKTVCQRSSLRVCPADKIWFQNMQYMDVTVINLYKLQKIYLEVEKRMRYLVTCKYILFKNEKKFLQ